jgi:hypothetical protein
VVLIDRRLVLRKGRGPVLARLAGRLLCDRPDRVVVVPPRAVSDGPALDSRGPPRLGTVDDLVEFARRTRVDLVIVSLPISAESRVLQMLKKLWVLPVDIRLSAHTNKLRFRPRAYSYIGNGAVLDVFDKPIADWDLVIKWLFDSSSAALALCCCRR